MSDPVDLRAAEIAMRRLAAIVESSDDAIISKDLNGIVTSWNGAAERIFGYTADEMIGRSIRTLIPADRQSEEDEVLSRLRRGERVDHFDTVRQCKNGSLLPISLTISPIVDRDGTVVGASKIARDITERREAEAERSRLLDYANEQTATTEQLNRIGVLVAGALDRDAIAQAVTDAATDLTGAAFGVFFYNAIDEVSGQSYSLYTLSGASRADFEKLPHPRGTDIFSQAFRGAAVVRLNDVTKDPRYGRSTPFFGTPPGHRPARSYLAVPVKARSGEVLGVLFFGHQDAGRFTDRHERVVTGVAAWASVALENARLYRGVEEASRLKDEFFATLSHELRTPLNAILGYSRMIRSGLVSADKQERAIETIERNATSLTQIIEDVLDVSRIITGKVRLDVQPVDLPKVVNDAVDTLRPAADGRGIRIEMLVDPRAEPIFGDPDRLQQIIWNLMSNAVKFTNRGGKVQVRLARVNSHVEVVVSDTGIGISPDFLPHVFERFRQADSGTTRERGGLGLGLAIARHLAEMHGGSIEVQSAGKDQGTTFRVILPVMVAHPDRPGDARVHPRHHRPGNPEVSVPDLHDLRVLTVDDDRDALRLVREILEVTGAHVTTAGSGAEALAALVLGRPDVIIADLGMPHMDGFELIHKVRTHADPAIRTVPAAALTAYARSEDRAKALRSGFQLHLTKPIDPAELMAAISALTRRAGL